MKKNITIAHSPDADDIFMYYAIKYGWVDTKDIEFKNIALDIETLNIEALKSTYDVTAISFAVLPYIKDNYALLKTAVSFGNGYGPKIIKFKNKNLKSNFKVAISGKYTTNALIFKLKYPNAKIVYKNFLKIEEAVLSGEVDAGVLIHESILNYDDRLTVESEIFDIWNDYANGLPLPLGGMAIRRSIPLNRAIECENILINGVKKGLKNSEKLSQILLEDRVIDRVNKTELKKYLDMYANNDSIEMSEIQIKALDKLYEIGLQNGFYNDKIITADYMIPSEYGEHRWNNSL